MKINPKVIESWLRHLKGNAAVAVAVPLFLSTLHEFQAQGFKIGFNKETVFVLLIAVAIASITVAFQVFVKKRPDLAPELAFAEKKSLDFLNNVAGKELAASPAPATLNEGVRTP